jgi:hypothetical protein
MSLAADLREISCPGCGAGLSVLGGGRVTTHICGYCGSALDAVEGYRVLRQFTSLRRPASPFSIGMEGVLSGATYRVIGTLVWEETAQGGWWTWADHLLYSPTHGYAWLTVEDGHLVYTRRHRGATSPSWVTVAAVESAESPPLVYGEGECYKYYETSTARITFAEGEFTWRPMVGDQAVTISALSEDAMLQFSENANEREVERSIYLSGPATLAAFGATQPLFPGRVHPLQPWRGGPDDSFLIMAGLAFMAACVALGLGLMAAEHSILPQQIFSAADLPLQLPLEIATTDRLASVTVSGRVDNGWAFVEVSLSDPADTPVFAAGREIDHYSGYDADGSWTEGTLTTSLWFRPETPGTYTLEIDVPEAGRGEETGGGPVPAITVSATEGGTNALWMFGTALLFGAVALWKGSGPYLHRRARWRGTDWTDED